MARTKLLALYDDVARRAALTSEAHTWWPCRRGCDTCCRRLADIPQLGRAEWELLQEGLALLPEEKRLQVARRIEAMRDGKLPKPLTCPMLDEENGACSVYRHRPLACRTYGFYVERDLGLHCDLVTEAVASHPESEVVWGNDAGAADARSRIDGGEETRQLTAWVTSSASESTEPPGEPRPEPSSPSSEI